MSTTRIRTAIIGVAATGMVATSFGVMTEANAASVPSTCRSGSIVCISKDSNTLRLMRNGRVVMSMSARFGAASTPTHNGLFRIYWKDLDHVSRLFGSAMPYSLFFDGGQAIHFSSDFATHGFSRHSHGCVNLRSISGARALFNSTFEGERVYVY